jgi:hypothetical protein
VGDWPAADIQRKILDRIIIAQAAALPTSCRPRFHYEQSDARSVCRGSIEQRTKNFLLRGAGVNAGHRVHEAAGNCCTAARPSVRRLCGQFRYHTLNQFRLQFGQLAVENLRHRAFDNLLDLLAIRHWSENHFLPEGLAGRNDTT